MVGLLSNSSRKLITLINNYLDFAKIEAGYLKLNLALADLRVIAQESAHMMQIQANARGQTLTVTLPPDPLNAQVDGERFQQVLDNLLSNAIKYTPEGGQIWLELCLEQEEAVFRVRDTGIREFGAGLVIVQHIAPGFVGPLASRLNELSQITVREAAEGMIIRPGLALLAPVGVHMQVERRANALMIHLDEEPAELLHRPSADQLFYSVARSCGSEACGVILTGMGEDGAAGLAALHKAGSYTIAQNEATCVVYGMPRKAVELRAVDQEAPLPQIPQLLTHICRPR